MPYSILRIFNREESLAINTEKVAMIYPFLNWLVATNISPGYGGEPTTHLILSGLDKNYCSALLIAELMKVFGCPAIS